MLSCLQHLHWFFVCFLGGGLFLHLVALSRRVERILQRLFDVKTYSFIYYFFFSVSISGLSVQTWKKILVFKS